ncbi:MAG: glutamine-hydrolyzing carbamoyl-phosphate synthase small subunit [Bdellovibrionaceae bacterium]|jgi:carbamoyl-phosphate synthase small subunit|nr:glutamine-hydrolyzing carbamoyl-phosphate synthase small subunit [Pseudobdellovibrionaceae bacterium]
MNGYIVLETGECFPGKWQGGEPAAGEVVFNTSHSGYEEIATDPSYFSQIMVFTSAMQGNYGADSAVWESDSIHLQGVVCLEMQKSIRDRSWLDKLEEFSVPVISEVDTRKLVLHLRDHGTVWGAMVQADSEEKAMVLANALIETKKNKDADWVYQVSTKEAFEVEGEKPLGPKVAILDFGSKQNIIRELKTRCSKIKVFNSRTSAEEIRAWSPDGIMLTNGPGDPSEVKVTVSTVSELLGQKFIFGICMGHQILCRALGGSTYRLKFGHRGSNHPVKDEILNKIYMTSQNHGYAVKHDSLPSAVKVSHTNLNDNTVSGISCPSKNCLSVQFHPESHPGPRESDVIFDYFIEQLS